MGAASSMPVRLALVAGGLVALGLVAALLRKSSPPPGALGPAGPGALEPAEAERSAPTRPERAALSTPPQGPVVAPAESEREPFDRAAAERLAGDLFAGEPDLARLVALARDLLERAAAGGAPPEKLPYEVELERRAGGERTVLRVLPGRAAGEAEFQLELELDAPPGYTGSREGLLGGELDLRFDLGAEGVRTFIASSAVRFAPGTDKRAANAELGPVRLGGFVTTSRGQAMWVERSIDCRRRADGELVGVEELGEPRMLEDGLAEDARLVELLRGFVPG